MKSIKNKVLAPFAAVAAMLPGASKAAIVDVNFTGVYDQGTPLAGQAFTGSFGYDDTTEATLEVTYTGDFSKIDQRLYDKDFLTSAFKITNADGSTSSVAREDARLVINYFPTETTFNLFGDSPGAGNVYNQFFIRTSNTAFAKNGLPSSFPAASSFSDAYAFRADSGQGRFASVSTGGDVIPVTPVPEPATWGMMIAGASMAGAALRRRRNNVKTKVSFG